MYIWIVLAVLWNHGVMHHRITNRIGYYKWDTSSVLGSTYQLKVYAGLGQANPQTNGTQLLNDSDNDDERTIINRTYLTS